MKLHKNAQFNYHSLPHCNQAGRIFITRSSLSLLRIPPTIARISRGIRGSGRAIAPGARRFSRGRVN